MLNYSKIHSLINYDRTSKRSIAKHIGLGESTLRSRLERKNLTPDDLEKIADFFDKPIAYFFDKDENEVNEDQTVFNPNVKTYSCTDCIDKEITINKLMNEKSLIQSDLIESQSEVIRLQRELLRKENDAGKRTESGVEKSKTG